ncbi:MAG: hypothetical protein IIT74_04675, partial [Bacteroidales bacterium]|nr:hypothetical protein [Bacteroidales bacterium]
MDKKRYTISANVPIAPQVYRMELTAEAAPQLRAGQFVEVAVPGQFLRRPLSVSLSEPGRLTLRYKVVGGGTAALAAMQPGTELELLTGLGNGFDIDACPGRALLLGGGIGVAPLHQLCRDLRAAGRPVTALLGFNTASECNCFTNSCISFLIMAALICMQGYILWLYFVRLRILL